ncbi:MAG: flagellar basal body P-ring formation chaperone FlgA [Synergistaceae bacterium]|nr:flagellar basal body P-ring formation chaperone FlgA [Synergistaceae bacterium]
MDLLKNIKARRIIPLLFFIFLLLPAAIASAAPAGPDVLSIRIPDEVRSAMNSFTLSEIADIEGPKESSRIAGMLRFSVPASHILLRDDVINAIQKSGITGVRIELRMSQEVSVEVVGSVSQTGGANEDERRNLSDVIKKLSGWKFDVEAVPQGQIPQGALTGPASVKPGAASVNLKFRDNKKVERTLLVRLTWYQPAIILKRAMKRGEIIRAEDIGERSVKIITPNVYASSPDEVVGKSLRNHLQQGEMILLSLLANMPIIHKGKIITIYINSEGIIIESPGEALQDGSLGDRINVRNLSSKKIVSGIIRTPERVEVLNQ